MTKLICYMNEAILRILVCEKYKWSFKQGLYYAHNNSNLLSSKNVEDPIGMTVGTTVLRTYIPLITVLYIIT